MKYIEPSRTPKKWIILYRLLSVLLFFFASATINLTVKIAMGESIDRFSDTTVYVILIGTAILAMAFGYVRKKKNQYEY